MGIRAACGRSRETGEGCFCLNAGPASWAQSAGPQRPRYGKWYLRLWSSPHFRSPVTLICPASFVWVLKPTVSPRQASFSPRTCPRRRAGGSDSHSPHHPGQRLFCALRPTLLVSFAELSAAPLRPAGLVWGPGLTLAHRRCPEAGAERCPPASPL